MNATRRGWLLGCFGLFIGWTVAGHGLSAQQAPGAPPQTGAAFDAAKVPAGMPAPKIFFLILLRSR